MSWSQTTAPIAQTAWQSIASSEDGTKLVAVIKNGTNQGIYTSSNAGTTWTNNNNSFAAAWQSVASSADGTKLVAVINSPTNGGIYTSSNSGVTWSNNNNAISTSWYSIASSADGSKLVAVVYNGGIYTSSNFGVTWSIANVDFPKFWRTVASSADGIKLVAISAVGGVNNCIYTSINAGVTWVKRNSVNGFWYSVASSADGTKLVAVINNISGSNADGIYTSGDSGITWNKTSAPSVTAWYGVASSADGSKLVAIITNGGGIYTSFDSGATWKTKSNDPSAKDWQSVASSADGTRYAAVATNGGIYTSNEPMQLVITPNSTSTAVTLPLNGITGSYQVDWGDGTAVTTYSSDFPSHTYSTLTSKNIQITVLANGTISSFFGFVFNWQFSNILTSISSWGYIPGLTELSYLGGNALTTVPTTVPSSVTDMSHMFSTCQNFTGIASDGTSMLARWDVSQVNDMSNMFTDCQNFTGIASDGTSMLARWDVSQVNNMAGMFASCAKFNGDISQWNVSRVENISYMFQGILQRPLIFNQDISQWNVGKVQRMYNMFTYTNLNQNLSLWNIGSLTTTFNQSDFASFSQMDILNFSNLLIGWAGRNNIPSNINFTGAVPLTQIYQKAQNAYDTLKNTYGWVMDTYTYTSTPILAMKYNTPTTRVYTQGILMVQYNPALIGSYSNVLFTVDKPLPTGLVLDPLFGTIRGTPLIPSPPTDYTITATPDGSSANALNQILTFTVNADSVYYSPGAYVLIYNNAITQNISPIVGTSVSVSSYAISPTLPAGLNFSTGSGQIDGTPTAASVSTLYTITVTLIGGKTVLTGLYLTIDDITYSTPITLNIYIPATITPVTLSLSTGSTLSLTASTLPASITFNAATGVFSGTATELSSYSATVTLTNGSYSKNIPLTFNVTNTRQTPPMQLTLSSVPANAVVTLPLSGISAGGNYVVDWGDATTPSANTLTHTYPNTAGMTYSIQIWVLGSTTISRFGEVNWTGSTYLSAITNWGNFNNSLTNLNYIGSAALTSVPTSVPSSVTNMAYMFYRCYGFNQDISQWVVSQVTNMSNMFFSCSIFNQDISQWNVGQVDTMDFMFFEAYAFNQNLAKWNITNLSRSGGTGRYMFNASGMNAANYSTTLRGWAGFSGLPFQLNMYYNPWWLYAQGVTAYNILTNPTNQWYMDPYTAANPPNPLLVLQYNAPTTRAYTQGIPMVAYCPALLGSYTNVVFTRDKPLPAGLTLDAFGAISGTPLIPTAVNSYTITATPDGSAANAVSRTLTFTISNGLVYYATSANVLVNNRPITRQIRPSVSGSVSVETYAISPSLPSGLNLNVSTGQITGTPTVATASTLYTVTAALEGSLETVLTGFYLAVDDITYSTPITLNIYIPATITPVTLSLSTGSTLSLTASTLPASITFNAATGVFSGTATELTSYSATVTLTNGSYSKNIPLTFNVTDTRQTPPMQLTLSSVPANAVVTLPLIDISPSGNYVVDWGDATTPLINTLTHTYPNTAGMTYSIQIWVLDSTTISRFGGFNWTGSAYLTAITNWGNFNNSLTTLSFIGGAALTTVPTTIPSSVTNMSNMFFDCSNFTGSMIGNWDVRLVEDMTNMFYTCRNFNGPIGGWNVSRVTNMTCMLNSCTIFNQDISQWDVRKVTSMIGMFNSSTNFNQNLDRWNIKELTTGQTMFSASAMDITNYSATLRGWALLFDLKTSVDMTGNNWTIYQNALASYNILANAPYNWVMGGYSPSTPVNTLLAVEYNQPTTRVYTQSMPILSYKPALVGYYASVSFASAPPLPAGLVFDAKGIISGTPLIPSLATSYNITATPNIGTPISQTLTFTVSNSSVYYSPGAYVLVNGTAFTPILPTVDGVTVTGYAIDQALPSGLNFTTGTGQIDGTPTAATASTLYTVTATLQGGGTVLTGFYLAVDDITYSSTTIALNVYLPVTITPTALSRSAGSTLSLIDSTLPPSITFNTTTGVFNATGTMEASYSATVTLTNGSYSKSIPFTFTVIDTRKTPPMQLTLSSVPANAVVTLPLFEISPSGNYVVDWGDATTPSANTLTHTYPNTAGMTYSIQIWVLGSTTISRFGEVNWTGSAYLSAITDWGNFNNSLTTLFCIGGPALITVPTTIPASVTNMSNMFLGCSNFTGSMIGGWDVSQVTNMSNMFSGCSNFTGSMIGGWNVNQVNFMDYMFSQCGIFNGPIGGWNVGLVQNMTNMFYTCTNFNQDISNWNVSNVTLMSRMFSITSQFNQDISNWDVRKVTTMVAMFQNANSFNQNLDRWNIKELTTGLYMFSASAMDITNYSATLRGWAALPSLKTSVNMTNNNWTIYQNALASYNTLAGAPYNWDMGGYSPTTPVNTVLAVEYNQPTTRVYTQGIQILSYKPALVGSYASVSFAAVPPLPAGLALDAVGTISGTPLIPTTVNTYTITATPDGSAANAVSRTLTFTISNGSVYYSPSAYVLINSTAFTPILPTVNGVFVLSYTITPTLPAGLNFTSGSGQIAGTPTAARASTLYTVTARIAGSLIPVFAGFYLAVDDITYSSTTIALNVYLPVTITPTALSRSAGSTLSLINSTLPPSITFNTATGVFNAIAPTVPPPGYYSATVILTNGSYSKTIPFTFNVTETRQMPPMQLTLASVPANAVVTLPLSGISAGGNYVVDWGDATTPSANTLTHTYPNTAGSTYSIQIWVLAGTTITTFGAAGWTGSAYLTAITNWGNFNNSLTTLRYIGGAALLTVPTSVPASVTNMSFMFNGCSNFTGIALDNSSMIGGWDVSNVINMTWMFTGCEFFNGFIGGWDVGQVNNMAFMFNGCSIFNKDIGSWNVSNVTNMGSMLRHTSVFNQDISRWNVGRVTNMGAMLQYANVFNQNLGQWNLQILGTGSNMFNIQYGTGMDVANFSATLIGWAGRATTKNNVDFRGAFSGPTRVKEIYLQAQPAYDILKNTKNWLMDTYTYSTTPPLLVEYNQPTTRVYTQGIPIGMYTPTLLGSYTSVSFAAVPPLPAGLTLDPLIGTISGTPLIPSSVQATPPCEITATPNSGTPVRQTLTFTVSNGSVYYSPSANVLINNTAFTPILPTLTSGVTVTGYAISPTLPAGLNFNITTGQIAGTPTAARASTLYTVTATLQGGGTVLTGFYLAVDDITYSSTTIALNIYLPVTITPTALSRSAGSTLSLINSTLPPSITFNTTTGVFNATGTMEASYSATVTLTNGSYSKNIPFTFNVTETRQTPPMQLTLASVPANAVVTLPLSGISAGGNYVVDWGDATTPSANTLTHTYPNTAGSTYSIQIWVLVGTTITTFGAAGWTGSAYLTAITNWGNFNNSLTTLSFIGGAALLTVPTYIPSSVRSTNGMFIGSTNFTGIALDNSSMLGGWDVSQVTNMASMFNNCQVFNGFIGGWDVGQVNNMAFMFNDCKIFNKDIGSWDVRNVTNMGSMLRFTELFNQDISRWNVGLVTDMGAMLQYANVFNQNLGQWNVQSLTTGANMFNVYYGTGMDVANFSATLIGWAGRASTLQNNVDFREAFSGPTRVKEIYLQAQPAYDILKNTKNWFMDTYTYSTTPPLLVEYNQPTTRVYTQGIPIGMYTPTLLGTYSRVTFAAVPPLPAGLALDPLIGTISGTPTTLSNDVPYAIICTAYNSSNSVIDTITNNVNFSVWGIAYSAAAYSLLKTIALPAPIAPSISGITAISYSITPNTLPTGLNFNVTSGAITGTPSVAVDTASYTVSVTTATIPYTTTLALTVADINYAITPYTYLADVSINVIQPTAFSYLYNPSFTFDKALPSGLSLYPTTGDISGIPLNPGQDTYTLTVSTANNFSSRQFAFPITVADINYSQFNYAFLNAVPLIDISCINVADLYNAYIDFNTLPTGIAVNHSTGNIYGTPTTTVGPATYTLTITVASNYQKLLQFQFAVADIRYTDVPYVYLQNQAGLYLPLANRGQNIIPTLYESNDLFESLSFSPALPPNLSISLLDGTISGFPTFAAAARNYTLRAVTTSGYTKDISFNIMVEGINYNADGAPPIYTFNLYDNVNIQIADNVGGFTNFTVTPPLPWGIGLNSITGAITGILRYAPYDNYSVTHSITGYRNPSITILLTIIAVNQFPRPCEYRCPPPIIIPRQVDTINTQAMRFSTIVRRGLGQTRFITNSGNNINQTYQEPARNKF